MNDLIKCNHLKKYVNSKGLKISKDFYEGFNEELILVINQMIKRAKANNRTTLMRKDL